MKNENILTALMILINELNQTELEILKFECEKRLNELKFG